MLLNLKNNKKLIKKILCYLKLLKYIIELKKY